MEPSLINLLLLLVILMSSTTSAASKQRYKAMMRRSTTTPGGSASAPLDANVKQLGSACNPLALESECGRNARCYPVPKCGTSIDSKPTVGICLCLDGFKQMLPQLPTPKQQPSSSSAIKSQATDGEQAGSFSYYYYDEYSPFPIVPSNLIAASSPAWSPWADCQPIARLGQSCQPSQPEVAMTLDGKDKLLLPDGAVCDFKSATVKCRPALSERNGHCVESLGRKVFGERCSDRLTLPTACDTSRRLACLPPPPSARHTLRSCQCPPGFVWKNNSTCELVGIGDTCKNNYTCNIAQYRSHTNKNDSTATTIALCDQTTNTCQCNYTAGYLTVTTAVPNINVTIVRQRQRLLLYQVDFSSPKLAETPLFLTETRCLASSFIKNIGNCGDKCTLDLSSASPSNRIDVCRQGLICHQCPQMEHARCVRAADPEQSDFVCSLYMMPPIFAVWLLGAALPGFILVFAIAALTTFLLIRRRRRQRRYYPHHQHHRLLGDSNKLEISSPINNINSNNNKELHVSIAPEALILNDDSANMASSTATPLPGGHHLQQPQPQQQQQPEPQVWATFRITPWRT